MFEHQEPQDGIRPLPVPPEDQSPTQEVSSLVPETQTQGEGSPSYPRQERVRHLLYGSLAGLDRTIKILHLLGYANPNDWSEPMPVQSGEGGQPHQWMVIMTKILLLE